MDNNIIKIYKNHKYNISPVLSGGLGNNLFQIAAVYSYAWDMKLNIVVEDIMIPGVSHQKTYAGQTNDLPLKVSEIFPNINSVNGPKYYWRKYECQEKEPGKFILLKDYLPKYMDKVKIVGAFVSSVFFDHNRDKIQDLLTFSPKITDYITNKYKDLFKKKLVGVHIRRGDYIVMLTKSTSKKWCILDMNYYRKAFNEFKDMDVTFVFFSEDSESKEWIHKNLITMVKNHVIISNESGPVDLCLMSMCDHNIIANSTFSFWGAYLNKNKDKIVIVPSVWKKGDNMETMKIKVPTDWKIIECECILAKT